jgi:hypothetical protein
LSDRRPARLSLPSGQAHHSTRLIRLSHHLHHLLPPCIGSAGLRGWDDKGANEAPTYEIHQSTIGTIKPLSDILLHTQGTSYVIDEIDRLIKARKRK